MDLDRQDKRILATLKQDGSVTNLELAEKRAGQVLVNMVDAGYLSKGEAVRSIKQAHLRRLFKQF